jgi:hypothetical protein
MTQNKVMSVSATNRTFGLFQRARERETWDRAHLTPPTPRMIAGKIVEVEIGRCKQSSITVMVLQTYSN